jgi:hypothetical protein
MHHSIERGAMSIAQHGLPANLNHQPLTINH